jgi:hypothetical protein
MKPIIQKGYFRPNSVEIEISHKCVIVCKNCAIKEDVIRNLYSLSEKEILDFLNQAKRLRIFAYSLTGGEPFLFFSLMKNVIRKTSLDLIKIDTNGYIFSTPQKTKQIFKEMKIAGFGIKNTKIRSWLNISIGQQTDCGIPLENSVFAAREFYNYFPKDKAGLSFNVFSGSDKHSMEIIKKFVNKYEEICGLPFDQNNFPFKLIPANGRICSTAIKINNNSKKKDKVINLINYYSDQKVSLNCLSKKINLGNGTIAPRLLLRADGSLYSCPGFAYVFKLGNIRQEKLSEIMKKANKNLALQTVFKSELGGLLKLAEKKQPGISNKKISINYGPCNICALLRNIILSKNSKNFV